MTCNSIFNWLSVSNCAIWVRNDAVSSVSVTQNSKVVDAIRVGLGVDVAVGNGDGVGVGNGDVVGVGAGHAAKSSRHKISKHKMGKEMKRAWSLV